ncbi:MAG TPA: hypothetical protein VGO89_03680 [Streptomyces sp.]|nr:hypothetical protein [Streptomyces sp.]
MSAARGAAKSHERTHTPDEARGSSAGPSDTERLRRRARFLRERNEAKELRDRVQPRRARKERLRQALRMGTFRR